MHLDRLLPCARLRIVAAERGLRTTSWLWSAVMRCEWKAKFSMRRRKRKLNGKTVLHKEFCPRSEPFSAAILRLYRNALSLSTFPPSPSTLSKPPRSPCRHHPTTMMEEGELNPASAPPGGDELYNALHQRLVASGEYSRLQILLKRMLDECGWETQFTNHATRKAKTQPVLSVPDLVDELSAFAKGMSPPILYSKKGMTSLLTTRSGCRKQIHCQHMSKSTCKTS